MMSKRKRKNASASSDKDEEVDQKPSKMALVRAVEYRDEGSDGDTMNNDVDMSQLADINPPNELEEAEVGIIEHVMVKNFMCHNIQEIKFGPQVNFVIGRNGSGKSAILTGLMVGLGGKALATSRGNSLKGFIKNDKQVAEVMVKIRNRGPDAWKPELYGSSIIIERRITRDTSSYKLKGSNGRLQSTKREELSCILDNFNIQVDNPIVILNQETCKNFLNSRSPHDKYKFFLKATQLDQMKQDYIRADESKETAIGILKQKEEILPTLEKEVFDWEQKFKALASLKDLRAKVDRLKGELVWAVISEREKGLEPVAKELRTEDARTPKFLQKVEESENEVSKSKEKHSETEKELKALSDRVSEIEPLYVQARREKEQKKKIAKDTALGVRKLQREITSLNKDRDQISAKITEIKNSTQKDYDAESQAREERMSQIEVNIQDFMAKKRTTEHEIEQFRSAVNMAKKEHHQARLEYEEAGKKMDSIRKHIHNLKESKSNQLRRFGSYIPELIRKIDQAHQRGVFHQKPRGPIGAHIQVKEQSWALAIESCLKAMIFAFCCHDHHDEGELEKIMQQVCPQGKKPSTITSAFMNRVYNVSSNRPDTNKYATVLEMLEISDPVIANCLIDQRAIESILLIPDMEESRNVMSRNPPRKAREAFNIEGDQIHHPFRYYSNQEDKVKILVSSVDDDIRGCERDLKNCEVQEQQLKEKVNIKQREITSNKQQENKTQTRLMKLQEHLGKLNMELDELKNFDEPIPVDVKTLEEEMLPLEENIKKSQQSLQEKEEIHNQANVGFLESDKEFTKLDSDMKTISENADTIKDKLAHAEEQIQAAMGHKKYYDDKLKEHNKKISDLRKKHDKYKSELESESGRAEQFCARVRTKRSSHNLESEIKQITLQIATEERLRGNQEEITMTYKRTKEHYMEIRSEVNNLNTFLKALDQVMKHREAQYAEFRRMIATRAKFFFIVMLSTRKYSGKMVFDHRSESLDLNVMPSPESTNASASDLRSLSGGERSFATVCFILSLWDAMESPFRCLDEFDVFMDMVNRRISMDLMMSVAEVQKTRQFIFLTPQDMSSVSIDKSMVRIFQMQPPERGQQTLPYKPANKPGDDEDDDNENAE